MVVRVLTALLALCLIYGCNNSSTQASSNAAGATTKQQTSVDLSKRWSDTDPQINLHHIFLGEINRRGKPTGFHSRPGGNDPDSARISSIRNKPNRHGVYTAQIEVFDEEQGRWKEKFSSLFPDALSYQEVIDIILHAYANRDTSKNQPWSGPSGLGFEIQGYTNNRGSINTAFPVFVRN